jgi:outer membrane lipase/esterase
MSAIAWPIRAAAIGLVVLFVAAVPAAAGPFSSLVVFGDSLSDVGNIDNATPFFFKYPGQYYYQGRFSNGPVWVEPLAAGLGLPTIAASTDGGNDFAYGGAQTAGTGGLAGGFILDVSE